MHETSLKKRLLSGSAWAFSGKILAALFGFIVNALLARLLTPNEMGAYFLTFSIISVAAITAQLGLTQTVLRLVAESMGMDQPGRAVNFILRVLRILGVSALVVGCLLAFGGGQWIAGQLFHSTEIASVMGLAALWAAVLAFQNVLAEIFRGFHDIRLATLFGGFSASLLMVLLFSGLWMIQGHSDLNQIIVLALLASGTSVALSSLFLGKRLLAMPAPQNDMSFKSILVIAWPLWITNLILFVLTQADLWILGVMRTQEEVAIYGAAARIVVLVAMPLIIVNAVVPPIIAEKFSQGQSKELEKILRLTATAAGIPAFVVLGSFIFWAEPILVLVFGEYYRDAGLVLVILSIGQVVNVWAGSCGLTLMLTGHQIIMMIITIVSGVVVIVGAVLLVKPYGGVGVAVAAALGMALQNLLMLLAAKRYVGVWTQVAFFKR